MPNRGLPSLRKVLTPTVSSLGRFEIGGLGLGLGLGLKCELVLGLGLGLGLRI